MNQIHDGLETQELLNAVLLCNNSRHGRCLYATKCIEMVNSSNKIYIKTITRQ